MFQQPVDQIGVFFEGRHLEGRHAFDGDDCRFAVTKPTITTRPRLGFTQGITFMMRHELLSQD